MKRLLILLLVAVVLIPSCSRGDGFETWYGTSDRYGFMVAYHRSKSSLVIAAIPMDAIIRYRQELMAQGIDSDDLGAVASLFGRQGSHYLRADASGWDAYAALLMEREGLAWNRVRPALEAMVTLSLRHARYLSKTEAAGTLELLIGPYTSDADVKHLVRSLDSRNPRVAIYDMGRFLPQEIEEHYLRRWVQAWTEEALREAVTR